MKKSIKSFWCWLISFFPYRRVKINSIIGKNLKNSLEPITLKVPSKIGVVSSKKRNRESKK